MNMINSFVMKKFMEIYLKDQAKYFMKEKSNIYS